MFHVVPPCAMIGVVTGVVIFLQNWGAGENKREQSAQQTERHKGNNYWQKGVI